ncbi:hypothetical protein AE558_002301, partial [Salmonella enterica subsp. enterica serovar Braenderup]|nr:hypothetical protein [Salmonella enterica subsp. enterica serovar Braenderup]
CRGRSSVHAITHIVNKIVMLFFYVCKFPTILLIVCQQLWGSHGHDQTQ